MNSPSKRALFVDMLLGAAAGDAEEAARLAGYDQPERAAPLLLRDKRVRAELDEADRAGRAQPHRPPPRPPGRPERPTRNRAGIPEGKLEVVLKIHQLPTYVLRDKDGWSEFRVDCDDRQVSVKLRPKAFRKLEEAYEGWSSWVAIITGVMGPAHGSGFVLEKPTIQTFEIATKDAPKAAE